MLDNTMLSRLESVQEIAQGGAAMKKRSSACAIASVAVMCMLFSPSLAFAARETISGEVSEYVRMYNTQRYKSRYVGVNFNGQLATKWCTYRNWDNPDLWDTDIVRIEYETWSLGLRYASNDNQFTRLQFRGQYGSGTFPDTGGANGDYATYFKINTKGSYCPDPSPMPFSGTLNY